MIVEKDIPYVISYNLMSKHVYGICLIEREVFKIVNYIYLWVEW